MGKIIVFALLGLITIGTVGWKLGTQEPRYQEQRHQDTRFPTAVATPGKSRLEPEILAGWMLQGSPPLLLIDTRSSEEFRASHLRRAINRDLTSLVSLQSLRRLPRHKPIVLYGTDEENNASTVKVLRMTGLTAFYLPADSAIDSSLPMSGDASTMAGLAPGVAPGPTTEPLDTDNTSEQAAGAPVATRKSPGDSVTTAHIGLLDEQQR